LRYKGFIFDLDGVLIDSSKIHYAGWKRVINRFGKDFDYETFRRSYFGKRGQDTIELIFGKGKFSPEEAKKLSDEVDSNFVNVVGEVGVPIRGALEFIRMLKEANEKVALATSAPRQNVDAFLEAFSLSEAKPQTSDGSLKNNSDYGTFDAIVCGDDVSRGKPDPEVFLKAAAKLGESPKECIVFEDSVAGVTAAKAAGMTCVALLTTTTREALRNADYFIEDFLDKNLNKFISLRSKVNV
jgi:beta-phosphoglucomutase